MCADEEAVAQAVSVLARAAFARTGARTWKGVLCEELGLYATVELPRRFPFRLPEVRIDRRHLPRRIPHVEKSGKICIAPDSGILLDTSRPADLVVEALERARAVVVNGVRGDNASDLQLEFLAYWRENARGSVLSACVPDGPSRRIILATLGSSPTALAGLDLFADGLPELHQWAERAGEKASRHVAALFLYLAASFDPPDFADGLRVNQVVGLVRRHLTDPDRAIFRADPTLTLPISILVSMPAPRGEERVLFAMQIPRSAANDHGFRRGNVPLEAAIARAGREALQLFDVRRLDPRFVVTRGGGQLALMARRIALVGCGAVGSATATHLAAAGVGSIHLIDHDDLSTENIHRHALGASAVGKPKVDGLRRCIGARFPHVSVTTDASRVEDVLERGDDRLMSADLVLVAVGDPTLEAWLNRELHGVVRRVHVWIEPYGLGGHALLTAARPATGCFECLLDHGERAGLRASLADERQDFRASFAGCAGTFTPYGELDADRAAIEATRQAISVLSGAETDSLLVSWMEDPRTFVGKGLRLSPRGQTFAIGERRRERFVNPSCTICGRG